MKMRLWPSARNLRNTPKRRATSGGDKAEVGSSRMMMRAPENSTRDSSTNCCKPDGQRAHAGGRIDVEAEAGQELLRLAVHAAPIDGAGRGHRLGAEKDIFGDGQIGDDRQFLMHHADRMMQRIARRSEADGRAVDLHLAFEIGVNAGDDLHQGRLAGAVLADQPVDLACLEREAHIAQRRDAAE